MTTQYHYLFTLLIFLLVSIYRFYLEMLSRFLQKKGTVVSGVVIGVDHVIAHGLRHLFTKSTNKQKVGSKVPCDYILTIQFKTLDDYEKTVQIAAPGYLRILGRESLSYYEAGDTISVLYSPIPQILPIIMPNDSALEQKSDKFIIWGGCIVLLTAILITVAIQYFS